jgi:hypothetical protein
MFGRVHKIGPHTYPNFLVMTHVERKPELRGGNLTLRLASARRV